MTTRKRYSKEFKLDALSLIMEQEYPRAEAAKSLVVSVNMPGRWAKELQSQEGQVFRGKG